MANFSALKTAIQNAIKTNGNNEITGQLLQDILLAMVSTMGDSAINDLAVALTNEASTRSSADGQLQTAINAIHSMIDNGYVYAGIATPSSTPASGHVFYIAVQPGTYTNFSNIVVFEGLTILKKNGESWAKEQIMYKDGGVFDISAYKNATYADLTAALNGGTNIPQSIQKGGMSIKFVQSSDNKYVKFFCTAQNFTTDVIQWQGVDDEILPLSSNVPTSKAVNFAADKVEYILDEKQTIIGANAGLSEGTCHLEYPYQYRITNIGTVSIGQLVLKSNTTTKHTINSLAAGASTVITASADIDNYRAYCDGGIASFTIVRVENKIESSSKEILFNAKKFTIDKLEHVNSFIVQGASWVAKEITLLPKYSYTIEKLSGTGSIISAQAKKDGAGVTLRGFSTLTNIGDKCTVSVASEADTLRLYIDGGVGIVAVTSDKVDVMEKELDADIKDLASLKTDINNKLGTASVTGSGWSAWTSCKFYKDRNYKIKNISTNTNSSIVAAGFHNAAGGSVTYTGGSLPITAGNSITIKFAQDVEEFRLYFDGGVGTVTIEYDENIVNEIEENTMNVEIAESFSSKDQTKNIVRVSKTGEEGHFSTIAAAYASITDSAYTNQYEVVVFPGEYNEAGLCPPPFTHTHGLAPNSVVITSKDLPANPVFEQAYTSSKLSNMTIRSYTGYCIHFDEQLSGQVLVNENLVLEKVATVSVWSIIGGGSFYSGTKFLWKNCIFKGVGNYGTADCHTNGNRIGENVHLIFDSCVFANCHPRVGSVGGFGNCVVELINCNFAIGAKGLGNWRSPIRNIDDPTLYRFDTNEWQIIGGGNKNLSMWQLLYGKTIGLSADYPITISGSAADIIFGYNPSRNDVKTVRLDCTLISEYYIADEQAGYSGSSELRDVFQLWKRLGDCSSDNKELTVTVNGVSKTYTFTEDYLTTKTPQADIIAAMQAVLDNVTINTIVQSGYGYENVNTSDVVMIKVTAADILKGEFLTHSGEKATSATDLKDIAGVVCEDKPINEYVKVWTSAFRFDTDYADGEYGLDANGALDANAVNKIGFVKGYNFYLY